MCALSTCQGNNNTVVVKALVSIDCGSIVELIMTPVTLLQSRGNTI